MNDFDKDYYKSFNDLKERKPSLKTFISVGGWDAGGQVFSDMAGSAGSRKTFINSAIEWMDTHGFDGIDIDWEYPAAADRGNYQETTHSVSLSRDIDPARWN